jgi:SAM-dependent methyltransferase
VIMSRTTGDRVREKFDLVVNGPALFNAVVAGIELGVFDFLAKEPNSTFEEVQENTGVPAHQLRVLLFSLCTVELIARDGGRYTNAAFTDENLVGDREDGWGHILAGWQHLYYPAFPHLTEALRTGTNTALAAYPGTEGTLYQRLGNRPDLQRLLHRSMTAFTLRSLGGLLENLDLNGVTHVLDVGGGDGTTASRLAAVNPGVRFTVFDTPSVTEIGEDGIPADLRDRVTAVGGDIFTDPVPHGVDCVLFSHCLEVFSGDQIDTLLRKAFDALAPGGKVAVYGFNAADDEQRGVYGARLSLYLNVLATGQGMSYPASDYEHWLARSGLTGVGTVGDLPYEHGLTTGTKPR